MPKIPTDLTSITLDTPEGVKTIKVQYVAKGGLGVVYLDLSTKPPEPSRLFKIVEPGSQESYRQELEGASLLFADSPPQSYQCRFQEVDPMDGTISEIETDVYTMPLIPNNGVNISDRNKNNNFADPGLQDLPLFQRLKLFDNLAEQIQNLHHHNAIMPDLKPSNVLVSGSKASPYMRLIDGGGVAKLADIEKSARKRHVEEAAKKSAVSELGIDKLGPDGDKLRKEPPMSYVKIGVKKRKEWEAWFTEWKERNNVDPQTTFAKVVANYRSLTQAPVTQVAHSDNLEIASDGVVKGVLASADFEVSPITMTPEICLNDSSQHSISKQSDIYNMGRILFTLLGGDIDKTYLDSGPIKRVKPFTDMVKIVEDLFKEKFGESLSICQKELQDLLISSFQDDPKKRPNITELRATLKNLEQLSLTPSEQVDKLLTDLANQGATSEIIDALNIPSIQNAIKDNPSSFYQFFKTIHHLRADQPSNSALNNDAIEQLLKAGAAKPENHYAIFKATAVLQSLQINVDYPLSLADLKLSAEQQQAHAFQVLEDFSNCKKATNNFLSSDFFKALLPRLFTPESTVGFYKKLTHLVDEKVAIDVLERLDDKTQKALYADKDTQTFILSCQKEILKKITDPIDFAKQASKFLEQCQKYNMPKESIEKIKSEQANLCAKTCSANITSKNIDAFFLQAPSYLLTNPSIHKKIIEPLLRAKTDNPYIKIFVEKYLDAVSDPVLFAKQAKQQLAELQQAQIPEDILIKIRLKQAILCEKQCLSQLTINNVVQFTKEAPTHVLTRMALYKKITSPGDGVFIKALTEKPEVIKELLGQDPKFSQTLFSTKDQKLLSQVQAEYMQLLLAGEKTIPVKDVFAQLSSAEKAQLVGKVIKTASETQETEALKNLLKNPEIKETIINNPKLLIQCKQILKMDEFNALFDSSAKLNATKILLQQAKLVSHGWSSRPRHAEALIKASDIEKARTIIDRTQVAADQLDNLAGKTPTPVSFGGRDHLTTIAYCIAAFILKDEIPAGFTVEAFNQIEHDSRLFSSPTISA